METELAFMKQDALIKLGLIIDDTDIPYEEELIRNPYSVKTWFRYIEHKEDSLPSSVYIIYERAIKELPGSYKLWSYYLKFRTERTKVLCVTNPEYQKLNEIYERALVLMGKMPRIWLNFLDLLMHEGLITRTRRTFDRCLISLPVTQHKRVWHFFITFIKKCNVPLTAFKIFKRYLKIKWESAEDVVSYYKSVGYFNEAAKLLVDIINDQRFVSKHAKSKYQLWQDLCELMVKNVVTSIDVDAIIRQGIELHSDQTGVLWNALVEYYTRDARFDRARDVYEEAMIKVKTVCDFTQIFEGYALFEESMTSAAIEELGDDSSPEDILHVKYCSARYEYLIERRAMMLNSVKIRQNPHNVENWQQRALLAIESENLTEVVKIYSEALHTISNELAVGHPHALWVAFANFYEKAGQISEARMVFDRAVKEPFNSVDDLSCVWCEWIEMEIRHQNIDEAFLLLQQVTCSIKNKAHISYFDRSLSVQSRVHKSLKVWSLYADLEESFGSFEKCKAVYDNIVDLRIANPQLIMNYAYFLEEHQYFEQSFQAYERGIALFRWPIIVDLWNSYLTKFIKRFGGDKIERTRDLFEQCLEGCPSKYSQHFYTMYAEMEEKYGMSRHAMAIYERATDCVPVETKIHMFKHYIGRASEWYGITSVRTVYEKAILVLPDCDAREMCIAFAKLEQKLGEIDRARVIFSHCSQFCDPATDDIFWSLWSQFELHHGNEDTIREMLRVKRSVQAFYNTAVTRPVEITTHPMEIAQKNEQERGEIQNV